ncbi:Protein NDR1 [Abeliophyllum distichum]|uniref:Protein NDR1 n=1 Tax=Abeliophyllum distichum TaxID=126358 RepID=A0ABD1UGK5_9LAMI
MSGNGEGRCWDLCVSKCCRFIITSGFAALFLWLALRTSKPTCSIQDFYVPILNKTDHSAITRNNHSILFDLKLDNEMKEKGVHYDNISLTFFYGPNTSLPIANYTVPGFYQGHGKKARKKLVVEAHGLPWESAFNNVSYGPMSIFRVGLSTKVRFRIVFWYTKRHNLVVEANVEVNESGKKVNKKGIKLKSGSPECGCYLGLSLFSIVLVALL